MARREPDWLPVGAAIERILEAVQPLDTESLPVTEAGGRVLAEPVDSPIDQPHWDNSAMDGFAARAADIARAGPDSPVTLEVIEDVPAGAAPMRQVGPGQAVRIMTGAPVPEGADSVVRLEHTDAWQAGPAPALPYPVRVLRADDAARNIRRRGEDIARGDRVLEPGRRLRAAEVGLLAAVGRSRVTVHRAPRVALLSNGDELAGPEQVEELLAGRKIVDSNSYALAAAVRATGAIPVPLGIARDDAADVTRRLTGALDCDALITTAGASVGDHDVVKDALEEIGFELRFWRVKMRPGSPFSFGLLPRPGAPPLPAFGLPGNPVSALVTFEVLVRPALRRMLGRRDVHARASRVRLAERFPAHGGLTHFLRARIQLGRDGDLPCAWLTGPQGSGLVRAMAEADALVIVPEHVNGLDAGAVAIAIPLDAPDSGALEYELATGGESLQRTGNADANGE